jgi:hypothetical protein
MVKVYFTELAYLQLLVEVKKYCRVETGAILVGQIIGNDYYVFESLDSGINCRRSPSIFYRDNPYSEHLVDVVRAKYTKAYAIGFWHRHPGNFNQFSYDDLEANIDMARVLESNIISGLVNMYDNQVRLRFWQITLDNKYREAEVIVGNRYFSNLVSYKSILDVERQILLNESGCSYEHRRTVSSESKIDTIENPQNLLQEEGKKKRGCIFSSFIHKREKRSKEDNNVNIQSQILNAIYEDLSILSSRHIKCEKYRIDDPEQQDKVALSFYNLVNKKQCDVILYINKGDLIFAVQGKSIKYVKEALAKEIISVLEDNNGRVITSL